MREISYAYGWNHFDRDRDLAAVLRSVWPAYPDYVEDLRAFGAWAGREAYEAAYHIDHEARPVLVTHDLDGRRIDRVRLAPAERDVLRRAAAMNRPPYAQGAWAHHFALLYLLGDPGLGCVVTITGQTVYALHKYGEGVPDREALVEALLAGDAFGATWMTESQGGSDLGANQTVAVEVGGRWRLSGDKYFASGAGLTDYALVTARPRGAPAGPKGLALFLVPRLNPDGELNYHVRRLKDKSATRAVPSGEVELADSAGYLLGAADQGIYYTLETLTVSRLANAAAAMGAAQKAHLEVWGRVGRRASFGRLLQEHPLVRRDLTDLAVRAAGGLALTFYAVDRFSRAWRVRPPYDAAYQTARLLTHLAKHRTAEHASAMTGLAMELFGGLGFLEEYGVARWHREALITPIWEGPANIQALDFLEVVEKRHAEEALLADLGPELAARGDAEARLAARTLEEAWADLRAETRPAREWYAKDVLTRVADAVQVALLYRLAETGGVRYEKLARLYATRFLAHAEYPLWAREDEEVWG